MLFSVIIYVIKKSDVELNETEWGLMIDLDVDVDVVDLRAQADASMPASNNNVKLYNISNF